MWPWLEGSNYKRRENPAKTREDLGREIEQESPALQLARRTIDEARAYFGEPSEERGNVQEDKDEEFRVVAPASSEIDPEDEELPTIDLTEEDLPTVDAIEEDGPERAIPILATPLASSSPSTESASCIVVRVPHQDSDVSSEDEETTAIELARFIKSKGAASALFDLEHDRLLAHQERGSTYRSEPSRSKTKLDLGCGCSSACDRRCRCRKASRDCQPHCHSGALQTSIGEHDDGFCCGNTRIISEGKKVWPVDWTRVETVVGEGSTEEMSRQVDNFWEMQVLDQTPAARLIQQAGGIDAFLIKEGYGHEYGLRRARTSTAKARQAAEDAEQMLRARQLRAFQKEVS